MSRTPVRALLTVLILTLLTGALYPLTVTGIAQLLFPHQADGSILYRQGRAIGSPLVGQAWDGPGWFYGRPSAAAYDGAGSSGSNLGPTSHQLAHDIRQRIQAVLALEGPYRPGLRTTDIPVDLLTASGSGLDPDISLAAAEFQAPRIATVRGIPLREVRALISRNVRAPLFGFLGEPRVNVLELNLQLERLSE